MSEAEPAPEAQLDVTAVMRGIVDDLRRTDGFKGRAKATALAMIGVQISQFGGYVQQAEPEIPDAFRPGIPPTVRDGFLCVVPVDVCGGMSHGPK